MGHIRMAASWPTQPSAGQAMKVGSGSNLAVRWQARKRLESAHLGRSRYSGDGLFTEPIAVAQPWRREPLFVPLFRHSRRNFVALRGVGELRFKVQGSGSAKGFKGGRLSLLVLRVLLVIVWIVRTPPRCLVWVAGQSRQNRFLLSRNQEMVAADHGLHGFRIPEAKHSNR